MTCLEWDSSIPFGLQGPCEYVLVRHTNEEDGGLTFFQVTAENVQCGYGGVTCTKTIRAEVNGSVVELTLGRPPLVDGVELAVGPTSVFDHVFVGGRIVSTQLFVVVFFHGVGLEIVWDKGQSGHAVEVSNK
jgi:hypothetical protein